jgi:integrase
MRKDRGSITPEKREGKYTGKWYADIPALAEVHPRFRRRFDTERQARMYRDHVNEHHQEPEWALDPQEASRPIGDPETTLGAVAAKAEEAGGVKGKWKRGRNPSGKAQRIYVVDFLKPATQVAEITRDTLEKLVAALERHKTGPSTINRYLAAASGILHYAAVHKMIPYKPSIPWQPTDGGRIHWFTEEMEAAVRKVMEEKGQLAEALTFRVLCRSGLRWGEFESLERFQLMDPIKPRDKFGTISVDKSKTDSPRSVRIPLEMVRELRAMIATGTRPLYAAMRNCLKAAVKSCGYAKELTIHCCRHTTATRLALLGWNSAKIQKFMGHKRITTTERYIHLAEELLGGVAESLWENGGSEVENTSGGLKVVK